MLATVMGVGVDFPVVLGGVDDEVIAFLAVGGGILIAIIAIVFTNIRQVLMTRARERTRSEIAAYVAEGSMTAEDGSRLLGADQSDFEKKIAAAVSWGMLSADKAEKLIGAVRKRGADQA